MATGTSYAFTDPRAQIVWSKDLFGYAMPNIMMTPLMGPNGESFIHVNKELLSRPGKEVVFEAEQPLQHPGVGDDGDTRGTAEGMKDRNMTVRVHQQSKREESAGAMSRQLTATYEIEGFREKAKRRLGKWIKETMENHFVTCACGLYNENSSSAAIEIINESYPTSSRIFYGGQNAAGTLGNSGVSYGTDALLTAGTQANNLMGTKFLEKIKRLVTTTCVPKFNGGKVIDLSKATQFDVRKGPSGPLAGYFYVVFIHPLQTKAIRDETGATGWKEAVAQAQIRGNTNPLFSGAAFLWDGMIVWEYDRIPMRTGAGGTTLAEGFLLNAARTATDDECANGRSVARAFLMGAQGMCLAWAKHPTWVEDYEDGDNPFIKTTFLCGMKRTNFNAHGTTTAQQDEAIYCMDTEVITD